MLDNLNVCLKEFLGIESGSKLELIYEGSLELAGAATPIAGALINHYRFNRIEKRLNEINSRFDRLEKEIRQQPTDVGEFIKHKIFPLVLENVFDEQQDEKIQYIINGFETTVEHQLIDEDLTYTYFDILRQLRMAELKLLNKYGMDEKDNLTDEPIQGVNKYVVNKLQQLGLVSITLTWGDIGGGDKPLSSDRIALSEFGRQFIKFFKTIGA
ncbi:hypothetical protein [Ammoniphilus sp. 3BR4]|uniref:hypothetical protein n=1 Tax=Ammoniphilus sp. 3BR4 TaxID=3158265 RepID=UPI003466A0C5